MALDSGLVDEKEVVTCDKAEELGEVIQRELDDHGFGEVSFKRKKQIKSLQSLYSEVQVGDEKVTIDPLTLFLRLIIIIQTKPDDEIADYFGYELSPYPMSLFKDGIMRDPAKSTLKTHLLQGVQKDVTPSGSTSIADGGALLWCCNWKTNEFFSEILKKYVKFLSKLKIDIVIFDGYSVSTKDATHSKREKSSNAIEIQDQNRCPADRKSFLSNYTNKQAFIDWLSTHLADAGFEIVKCPADADTTIVKAAINQKGSVNVYSDDTDILCLLLHHFDQSLKRDIILCEMTKAQHQARECVSIKQVIKKIGSAKLKYILFAHAFTGCDTTSAIHQFGKVSIFDKLKKKELQRIADLFNHSGASPDIIGNQTITFFEHLHSKSGEPLSVIRKRKYEEMVMANRAKIDPSCLPPSPRAAYFHGLRVYHQLKVWHGLCDTDQEPCRWGWEMKNSQFSPIMTDCEPGPQDLLKIVRCSCQKTCGKRCSCQKAGLKCTIHCKHCFDNNCSNTETVVHDDDEVNNGQMGFDEERHFLDAFN